MYDDRLARTATAEFLKSRGVVLKSIDVNNVSAAFGTGTVGGVGYAFEALINLDSLDTDLFAAWRQRYKRLSVLSSFPDDKDRDRLIEFFQAQNCDVTEIALEGTRGYLNYDRAKRSGLRVRTCDYHDYVGFTNLLQKQMTDEQPDFVYLVGTQTFIRLVKLALREKRTS